MAVTKAAPAKKAAPVKKAVAAKKAPAKRLAKGDGLECGVCGLSLIVDDFGDVVGYSEVICCGTPMKSKAARAPAKKAVVKKAKK